jgi:hypothetical protein
MKIAEARFLYNQIDLTFLAALYKKMPCDNHQSSCIINSSCLPGQQRRTELMNCLFEPIETKAASSQTIYSSIP